MHNSDPHGVAFWFSASSRNACLGHKPESVACCRLLRTRASPTIKKRAGACSIYCGTSVSRLQRRLEWSRSSTSTTAGGGLKKNTDRCVAEQSSLAVQGNLSCINFIFFRLLSSHLRCCCWMERNTPYVYVKIGHAYPDLHLLAVIFCCCDQCVILRELLIEPCVDVVGLPASPDQACFPCRRFTAPVKSYG